jgi:hypothetical protein
VAFRVARWSILYQKVQKSDYWEGLGMENIGLFQDHSVYFVFIWYFIYLSGVEVVKS